VFRSDLSLAEPPWILPAYRAVGGTCTRCGGPGLIPAWVYQFHAVAMDCRREASDQQRRSQIAELTVHLRRHRSAKRTTHFVQSFSGPWILLAPQLRAASTQQRRAKLTFLLWILDNGT